MPRIKIDVPQIFSFRISIPVRITDLNYGGHVGNDSILSLIHEARVQFLKQSGYKELDIEGKGLIMADVGIEFKSELFYGDLVEAHVTAGDFSKIGFDLYYKLEKRSGDINTLVAIAKTGMVYFDYNTKKIAALPDQVKQKLIAGAT